MLVIPVILLLFSTVAQFVVYWHASHVATAAAQEGARATQLADGSAEAGRASAEDFLRQAGARLVLDPTVTVTRNAKSAVVEIRGRAPQLVPGIRLAISASATGPLEVFEADAGP